MTAQDAFALGLKPMRNGDRAAPRERPHELANLTHPELVQWIYQTHMRELRHLPTVKVPLFVEEAMGEVKDLLPMTDDEEERLVLEVVFLCLVVNLV